LKIPTQSDAHLTYCLNVHPVAGLEDLRRAIQGRAARIFQRVANSRNTPPPYGLGLWLPHTALPELREPGALSQLREWLAERGFYAFTLNGFPWGRFHDTRVKQDVYRPDWSDVRRLDYTRELAEVLAGLLPEGTDGTISTLPVTYREWANPMTLTAAAQNLAAALEHLARLRRRTGCRIGLALEPEPDCYLDQSDGVVEFFSQFVPERILPHVDSGLREDARQLLGVCMDTVHSAVLFEEPVGVLERYHAAGVPVLKLHLGAAIVADWQGGAPAGLADFRDRVYLHQVRARLPQGQRAYADLPDALADQEPGERRVHYHVPLTWSGHGRLQSTGAAVSSRLLRVALDAGVRQFEVETYTLGVMPGARDDERRQDQILAEELLHCMELFERA
jgi:sugar phosphate isomerase/epimerase